MGRLSVIMHVLVDKVYTKQKIFILQDVCGGTHFCNTVLLGKNGLCRLKLVNKRKVMGTHEDGFPCLIKCEYELCQEALCPWIKAVGGFVNE